MSGKTTQTSEEPSEEQPSTSIQTVPIQEPQATKLKLDIQSAVSSQFEDNSTEKPTDNNGQSMPTSAANNKPRITTLYSLGLASNETKSSTSTTDTTNASPCTSIEETPTNLELQPSMLSPEDHLSIARNRTTSETSADSSKASPCTPTEEISPEQTNFLKLVMLILCVGKQALKQHFDSLVPPKQLVNALANNKIDMKKLFKKGTINKSQWSLLYPLNTKPPPSSKNFDLTLLMVLFRNLTAHGKTSTNWTDVPPDNDTSIGADVSRLQWYRNKVVHKSSCSFTNSEFAKLWTDISKVVVNVAGPGNEEWCQQQINRLYTDILDKSRCDMCMEMVLNLMNQDNTKYFQEEKLELWEEDDKTFVPTRATNKIMSLVERHSITMVTGPPGSGKSASVHNVALQFVKRGYRVLSVSNTSEIKDCWKKDIKQLFVVDDAFGYHYLNNGKCSQWKSDFNDLKVCFSLSEMKILITVRSTYEYEPSVRDLLEVIQPMKIQINDEQCDLSVDERRSIFQSHVTFNKRDDLLQMAEEIQKIEIYCFPLLCRLFVATKRPGLSPTDFFSQSVFKDEITKLKCHNHHLNHLKYFCLVMCVMYDNSLDESVFDISNNSERDKKLRKKFLELCGLSSGQSRMAIMEQLSHLLGTYLIKEGKVYRFIHDIVHDAVIASIDDRLYLMVLENCSSKFVKNRIRLEAFHPHEKTNQPFIILPRGLEKQWGRRVIRDLKDGDWYDALSNEYIVSKEGDNILTETILGMDSKDVTFIMCECHRKDKGKHLHFEKTTELNAMKELTNNLNETQECRPLHWIILIGLKCVTSAVLSHLRDDQISSLNSKLNLLSLSCICGDIEFVTRFTEGVDLNQNNNFYGLSPLFVACMHGHSHIADLLLRKGAEVNKRGAYGETSLYTASKFGFPDVVRVLLKHDADVNISEIWNDKTPLYAASKYGHEKVVRLLTAHNADMYITDKDGKTPLFLASEAGHFRVVEALIENKVDVTSDRNDYKGATPLYVASAGGHYDIVKLLLENGADINKRARYGETPLIASSRKGYGNIVKLLLEKEADVNRANRRCSRTPLFVATSEGQLRIVEMLIDKGAHVNKLTNSTPLCISCEKEYLEIAKLLINHGADVNKCEKDHGKTPLHIASEKGNLELVRLLIVSDAKLNQLDKDHGETPIHVAAKYGHREICTMLARKGADVNIQNERGKTALEMLSEIGFDIDNIFRNDQDCDGS